ncbi:MAG: HEAT repeat domain-containing protein [Chlorobi bacterium]|nr:HEAT repeat domain-containing protein [Chlorobiota bacterium]
MKKLVTIFAAVIFLFSSSVLFAGDKSIGNKSVSYEQIEATLLTGLNSDNFGLKVSSVYMLGEIKSGSAVNELTTLLRESDNEKVRLVAALSLLKIGTERSIFMVKQSRRFNASENVRDLCTHLYNSYLYQKFYEEQDGKVKLITFLMEP